MIDKFKTWFEVYIADFNLKNILLLLSPTIFAVILILLGWVVPETVATVVAISALTFVMIVIGLCILFVVGIAVMDIFGVHVRFFGR